MEHGTTLSGLMHHHGTDPHAFLDFVHDISLERISPDPELNADIRALPGRRLIFTNGDAAYASRSEEHTSELQSLMRISYAVFCLKNKITSIIPTSYDNSCLLNKQHHYSTTQTI